MHHLKQFKLGIHREDESGEEDEMNMSHKEKLSDGIHKLEWQYIHIYNRRKGVESMEKKGEK